VLPEVEEFFSKVRGTNCWSIVGGAGSGSIVSLRFGEKVRLERPLKNSRLSLEERIFDGERSLIVYCDWRLETRGTILSTSQSITEHGAIDLNAFDRIKNQLVSEIGFSSDLPDLRLRFGNDIVFSVFCDLPVSESEDSNYVMFNPSTSIAVTSTGHLAVEKR
jgi:hypothetical protein